MVKQKKYKSLAYYLNLPWTYTVTTEFEDGKSIYIIRVNELQGVCTDNEDLNNGMLEIKEAIAAAIKLYIKHGEDVPEPIKESDFSGKIAYRTTKHRHYLLVKEAKQEELSLSKFIDLCLDKEIQHKHSRA